MATDTKMNISIVYPDKEFAERGIDTSDCATRLVNHIASERGIPEKITIETHSPFKISAKIDCSDFKSEGELSRYVTQSIDAVQALSELGCVIYDSVRIKSDGE